MSGDATISFEAFDVDDGTEVRIFINDIHMENVNATGDESWESRQVTFTDPYVSASNWNYIRFDNTRYPPSYNHWGIRNLALVEAPTPAPTPAPGTTFLAPGWNLVSVPGHPDDTSPAAVLSSITGYYDVVYAYDASDQSDPWKRFDPGAPSFSNDLLAIDETKGLWLHTTSAVTWVFPSSTSPSGTTSLQTGWNLVGYPSLDARPIGDALASIAGEYDLVYTCDAFDPTDPWKMYDPSAPQEVGDVAEMAPGLGYWIHVTTPGDWVVSGHHGAPSSQSGDRDKELQALRNETGHIERPPALAGPPPLPLSLWGVVRVDGAPASDGTVVSAWIDEHQYAQAETFTAQGESVYALNVPGDDPTTAEKEGGTPDDLVLLKVASPETAGSILWQSGESIRLDLGATSASPFELRLPLVLRETP